MSTEIQIIAAAMDSKADETTANKLNQMESPEDLDVFVKELMDNMVSISTAFKLSGVRWCLGSYCEYQCQ